MASKETMNRVLGSSSDEELMNFENGLVKKNRRGTLLAAAGVVLSIGGVFCAGYDKEEAPQVLAGGIISTVGLLATVNGLVEAQATGEIILAIDKEVGKRKKSIPSDL